MGQVSEGSVGRSLNGESLARLLNGEQRQRLAGRPLASARRAGRGLAALAFDYQGLRRRVWRTLLFHAMAPATPVVAIEDDGLRFLVETADLGPGRIMFTRGSLEADVLDAAASEAQRSRGPLSDRWFVDVGANIGAASVLALGRHGFRGSIAIEPNADNVALLRANLAVNGVDERCLPVIAAAGGRDGIVELEISPDNCGDHRVRAEGAGPGEFKEERRATRRVSLRTLDSILAAEGISASDIGLLWIDVQGYEAQVLEGASTVLSEPVPVVIEFWPYGLRRSGGLEALCELVERHFASFVDLHHGSSAGGGATPQPIERLRSFQPAGASAADATDLLLLH